MSVCRKVERSQSNNSANTNKNICAFAVAKGFAVGEATRYLHNYTDVLRALRTKWKVRQCNTAVNLKKNNTYTKLAKSLKSNPSKALAYVVYCEGHIYALTAKGDQYVDTASEYSKSKNPLKVWAVYEN